MKISKALTIAGFDPSGGAGIQADLKVFEEFCVYGMSVVTAITAQNSFSISSIMKIPRKIFKAQLETLLEDIKPDAFKTGMISEAFMAGDIAYFIEKHKLKNFVLDPVMISKTKVRLCPEKVFYSVQKELFPFLDLITPNLDEAKFITGLDVKNEEDAFAACSKILKMGPKSVLLKGGHSNEEVVKDYYFDGRNFKVFSKKRINTKNTHGTGCSFSAAITALLACGKDILEAITIAEDYIYGAIKNSFSLGKGFGPLNHFHKRME